MTGEQHLRDGDRRNVTVLFADMKNFTTLSESKDPEEVDALMTRVFSTFEGIVHRHGGIVEKYIGDALVAVFGVPNIHEDDPSRAINAGLEMLEEISRINAGSNDPESSVGFRIGINTGLIATGKRGEHDVVTGHAMAEASRLQSEAAVNSILVAESTREQCAGEFSFGEPLSLNVKGKSGSVTAHPVKGRRRRPIDEDSVFVGRKEIIDTIFRQILRHDISQTAGIVLTGEAGIGKSRLVREIVTRCRALPEFRSPVLYARAMRYRSEAFTVILDLISGYLGLDAAAEPAATRDTIRERLGVENMTIEGLVELLHGTRSSQDNEAFVVLYLVLKDVLKRFAGEPYAALVIVDNLQFMDRQSRDFFRFFFKNADAKPFFLFTDRHPDQSTREVFAPLQDLELPPLSRHEAAELIDGVCEEGCLEDGVRESILDNSRGNPLFVREYVSFATRNRDTTALPSTIQNIFLTSIDPYEAPMQDLLKKLSVFVHSFNIPDARSIHEITNGDPRIVEPAIGFFIREGVLVQEDDLFRFRNDVFKTALYDSLLNYNKKILHRLIADRMIENSDPDPQRLLFHLIRAEEYQRATAFLWDVRGISSNMDYLPVLDALLENAETQDTDAYLSLLFVKAAILFNNGMSDNADSLLKDMIELAIRERNALFAGSAYHLLTAYNLKAYCFEKAEYCGRNGLAYYTEAGAPTKRIQNLLEIMATSRLLRDNSLAVETAVTDINSQTELNTGSDPASELSVFTAEALVLENRYHEAREVVSAVIGDLDHENDDYIRAHLLLGLANFHLCEWERMAALEPALLDGTSRHYANISQINSYVALSHHMLGETDIAARSLQQAEFNCSQVNNDLDRLDARRSLSECCFIMGDIEKASAYANEGLGVGLRHSATIPVMTLLMVLAEIAFGEGREMEARFHLREAGFLLGRGVLLRNRDVLLYHFIRLELSDDETTRESAADAARAALEREHNNLHHDRQVSRFHQLRSFGRIAQWARLDS